MPVKKKIIRITSTQLPEYMRKEEERLNIANEERNRWGRDIDNSVNLRKTTLLFMLNLQKESTKNVNKDTISKP